MNSRIKQFMDYKQITPSELADNIGVQRSNVTHVLNGRNKPSFQFIAKLLETYPEIDAKWLIMGEGEMLENSSKLANSNLFSEEKPIAPIPNQVQDENKETQEVVNPLPAADPIPITDMKKVERIVVFYTDQTFKEYTPSK